MSMGQETCRIFGQVPLNFILLVEKRPKGYMSSGEGLTRKQQTSRPDHLWPEILMENARKLRFQGIVSVNDFKLLVGLQELLEYFLGFL